MADEANTQPTIETLVKMISEAREEMRAGFERIETLLDRVASVSFETRAELRELKRELREHFPFVK